MVLQGKLAVVTGGANGIGAAIVRRFRQEGADVAIVDVVGADLAAFEKEPGEGRLWRFECNVTDAAAVGATCASIGSECGTPAILVNNAGGSGNTRAVSLEETTDDIWLHVMDLNLTSTLRFCRTFAPAMRAAGYGRIINMSSMTRYGVPQNGPTMFAHIPYVVSKAAVAALTAQLGKELGPSGVTANAIAPGLILPGPNARVTRNWMTLPENVRESTRKRIPLRRFGDGDDVAGLATFLASQDSGYLNGQTLNLDGG
jgi:3-oxoacyl-[acyl-carrier protein] reductase